MSPRCSTLRPITYKLKPPHSKITVQCCSFCSISHSLLTTSICGPNILLSHLPHSQSIFFPYCENQNSTSIPNKAQNCSSYILSLALLHIRMNNKCCGLNDSESSWNLIYSRCLHECNFILNLSFSNT